jgi:hypothetical protein
MNFGTDVLSLLCGIDLAAGQFKVRNIHPKQRNKHSQNPRKKINKKQLDESWNGCFKFIDLAAGHFK